mmetsp:Transcript_35033/g.81671  ORF Transcript_35033/g.81671 Transcript_35033/m.81671 type:complete len:229 (-) Transcript_35033:1264-1950(-)
MRFTRLLVLVAVEVRVAAWMQLTFSSPHWQGGSCNASERPRSTSTGSTLRRIQPSSAVSSRSWCPSRPRTKPSRSCWAWRRSTSATTSLDTRRRASELQCAWPHSTSTTGSYPTRPSMLWMRQVQRFGSSSSLRPSGKRRWRSGGSWKRSWILSRSRRESLSPRRSFRRPSDSRTDRKKSSSVSGLWRSPCRAARRTCRKALTRRSSGFCGREWRKLSLQRDSTRRRS